MASLEPEAESHPLLPTMRSSTAKDPDVVVELEEEDPDLDEANEEDKILFADNKKRGTSLILNDAVLLILHVLQLFAVLQSLALRWPLPVEWVKATHFTFLINLDIWEFMKVQTNGTFREVQGYYTPSASMPFSYWHLMLAWGIFTFLAFSAFVIAYIVITHRKHPFMMIKTSNLQRVYIIMTQVLCLPVGMAVARLFHCTDAGVMDVDNTVPCYENGLHWAYICPTVAFVIAFYGFLPAWMMTRTRAELLNMNSDRHEGYLQLKETEYVQGLDILYVVSRFHIFASFKKHGCHFRALLILFCFTIIVLASFTFNHMFIGAVIINCVLMLLLIVFLAIRPYRVTCFNVMLSFSYLCLMVFCLFGSLRTSFNSFSLASVWLTPTYLNVTLVIIAVTWLMSAVIFVVYLITRHIGFGGRFCPHPLWPSMTSEGLNKLSPETRKYVRSIIRCRTLIEKSLAMTPMFAPAHELSRQIQIINAFCREAEHLRDPIHDTLWDVLDELMEAHAQIAPRSLFAESVKESIRQTATEFMKMMPMMVRRLAQREYDFILVPPVKRRLLFKMYCMGVFLNGRREKMEKDKLTLPAVHRVYRAGQDEEDFEPDDGYYEDMYPERQEHMFRPDTGVSLGLFSDAGLDDDIVLQEAEEWTRSHPLSAGFANQGFEDDVSAILRDDLSDNMSVMMDGVPSASRTGSQLSSTGDQPTPNQLYSRLVVVDRPGSGHSSSNLRVTPASQQSLDRLSRTPPSREQTGLEEPEQDADPVPTPGQGSRPSSASRPRSAQMAPTSSTSRPGSASGSQSGSHNGSQAAVGQEWRQSPLPGQIHIKDQAKGGQEDGKVQELSPGDPGQSHA